MVNWFYTGKRGFESHLSTSIEDYNVYNILLLPEYLRNCLIYQAADILGVKTG